MNWSRLIGLFCFGFVMLSGCSSKTAQVNGMLVYSDKPDEPATDLEGYTVTFESADGKTSSVGTVGPDGKFTMSTFKEGDGALIGKMKIAVTPPIQLSDSSIGPSRIDKRHHALETSGLEADIKAGANNITLKVDRAGKHSQ